MDAKDWAKMADMIAQIRNRLFKIQSDHEYLDTEVYLKTILTREYLALALENIDKLARWDNSGLLQ
jgi:hypothetical protein